VGNCSVHAATGAALQVDYPAACNAVEKVLVHAAWASKPGPGPESGLVVLQKALEEAGVKVCMHYVSCSGAQACACRRSAARAMMQLLHSKCKGLPQILLEDLTSNARETGFGIKSRE